MLRFIRVAPAAEAAPEGVRPSRLQAAHYELGVRIGQADWLLTAKHGFVGSWYEDTLWPFFLTLLRDVNALVRSSSDRVARTSSIGDQKEIGVEVTSAACQSLRDLDRLPRPQLKQESGIMEPPHREILRSLHRDYNDLRLSVRTLLGELAPADSDWFELGLIIVPAKCSGNPAYAKLYEPALDDGLAKLRLRIDDLYFNGDLEWQDPGRETTNFEHIAGSAHCRKLGWGDAFGRIEAGLAKMRVSQKALGNMPATELPNNPPAAGDAPAPKPPVDRPAFYRDHLFLMWHGWEGNVTHLSPTKIFEAWNAMSDDQRRALCPSTHGTVDAEKQEDRRRAADVVKKAIGKAKRERADLIASKKYASVDGHLRRSPPLRPS